jgi:hypothetical protein
MPEIVNGHSVTDPQRTVDGPQKILLINVQRQCLEECAWPVEYVALSYMWGKTMDPFMTLRSNLSTLSEEGSLERPHIQSRLPQTIKDFMRLTAVIDQEYIWIDRFCIVQDDEAHKSIQIQAMAAIYTNASITILVKDGEDDAWGLRGIPTAMPRACSLHQFDFGTSCRFISEGYYRQWSIPHHRYDERGWTFQEEVLSRRRLIFSGGVILWTCGREHCSEYSPVPKLLETDQISRAHDIFAPWPNIFAYAQMVEGYSTRKLSYPQDALRAFSAIITVSSRTMGKDFLYGVPETYLDKVLLWQTYDSSERRRDKDGSALRDFPSRSWIGCTGRIDTSFWGRGHRYTMKDP